ncbi:alanine and proline-rich secreted protein Apa [Mycobacterium sp.]|uniref:alanine and proline-rich secreted protein Apa n=1 Tax=Mycobacterium sp. TaxID=1785 RepID=UPI0026002CA4|nr:alanine and proline-rich secreted protein Apa [Mycobacterium sp.]MBW0013038.1 hypothetical protein [Mycobacterium sp.]
MDQVDPKLRRREGPRAALTIAAVTSAFAVAIALPATSKADPQPVPPAPTTTAAPAAPQGQPGAQPGAQGQPAAPQGQPGAPQGQPGAPGQPAAQPGAPQAQPGDPNAAPPPPADPNAPPPPTVDPNAGRVNNAVGGFSFVLPAGWVESDTSHLDYGSELLSKTTGQPPAPGQPPPVANDTRIVMGRLDQKLYASAEANNAQAAVRLGSDMGEFFMPYPGTRINQETIPLTATNGITGSASYYEVKFSDPAKPNGQIWTGVVGSSATNAGPPHRWFVVWLGTSNDPVDKGAAKALAESIQPWAPPPNPASGPDASAPAAGAPGAGAPYPAAPAPGAPSPTPAAPAPGAASPAPAAPAPGAPSPTPAPAPGAASPSPSPSQAPAGDVAPAPTTAPQRTAPA